MATRNGAGTVVTPPAGPAAGCPECGRHHRVWPQRCAYRALLACPCDAPLDRTATWHRRGCRYAILDAWGSDLPGERDESFIPWSMIEPLLEEGITWRELGRVLSEPRRAGALTPRGRQEEMGVSRLTIYGASDDLIEVEGDIEEEFSACDEGNALLGFSDGTVLKVKYDGAWTFSRTVTGSASFKKEDVLSDEGRRPDGKPAYSEIVTLEGDIAWVVYGTSMARIKP